jgi:hypothetical protein
LIVSAASGGGDAGLAVAGGGSESYRDHSQVGAGFVRCISCVVSQDWVAHMCAHVAVMARVNTMAAGTNGAEQ